MTTLAVPETTKAHTTETALELASDLTADEWEEIGHTLGRANRASAWWIGDWVNYGEKRWGEKYSDAEEITGLSQGYLRQCAMVARRFGLLDRSNKLTWTHYFKAHGLSNAERWLAQAESNEWSVRELQDAAHQAPRTRSTTSRRHEAVVEAAEILVKTFEARNAQGWSRSMTDALTPPQAQKQLRVLTKAAAALAEVIEAVEYRAATPHTFLGR